MCINKKFFILVGILFLKIFVSKAQNPILVRPSQTLAALKDTDTCLVFLPEGKAKKTLLVHLIGTNGRVSSTTLFPKFASKEGYHVISLAYNNEYAARELVRKAADKKNYFDNFREQLCFGKENLEEIKVNRINCIVNRLTVLLHYLEKNYPDDGWGHFLEGRMINWKRVALSGHSQGAGHAARLAKRFETKRVILFGGPSDGYYNASAPDTTEMPIWVSISSATPENRYFSFLHHKDPFGYNHQKRIADSLGIEPRTPCEALPGEVPKKCKQFYSTIPDSKNPHSAMILDAFLPIQNGVNTYENVWKYLLLSKVK